MGGAPYVALKADQAPPASATVRPADCTAGAPSPELSRRVEQMLGRDFLAPVVGSFLFTDAFQRWVPVPLVVRDRGWVLAEHWADAWHETQGNDRLRAPLGALYADDAQRRLPMLFLNATSVDTGRRVIASKVSGPTKFVAPWLITATTSCPRFWSPRHTSTDLYAPIPPVTPSAINAMCPSSAG